MSPILTRRRSRPTVASFFAFFVYHVMHGTPSAVLEALDVGHSNPDRRIKPSAHTDDDGLSTRS